MYKILLFLVFIPVAVYACINIHGTNLTGGKAIANAQFFRIDRYLDVIKSTPISKLNLVNSFENEPDEVSKTEKNTPQFYKEENQAVSEILNGKFTEAIKNLLLMSEKFPNRYSTATNLGTAYELNGEVESALQWIKEGIRLNSKSHEGTEWLHQLILETKIKLKTDLSYLQNKHVINLPSTFTEETSIKILNTSYTIYEVGRAIEYQLLERMLFVKPKDAIVSDLLFTLSEIIAHTNILENSIEFLKLSKEYGYLNPNIIDQTIMKYDQTIKIHQRNDFIINVLLWLTIFLFIGIFWYFRKKLTIVHIFFGILILTIFFITTGISIF